MAIDAKNSAFTLTELAFVVVIIAIFISLLTPFINKIRIKRKVVACEENLQEIGLGLKLYANEHDGKFPPGLRELVEGGYIEDENVLDCPASAHAGGVTEPDYHYTTGYTVSSPSDIAIVFDKAGNHKDGGHTLYISGEISWK